MNAALQKVGWLAAVACVAFGAAWAGGRAGRGAPVLPSAAPSAAAAPAEAAAAAPPRVLQPLRLPAAPQRAPVPAPETAYRDATDNDPRVRAHAVHTLGKDRTPEAAAALLRATKDQDEGVRVMATDRLRGFYADGLVPMAELEKIYADESMPPKARSEAINGIGAIPSPESAAFLRGAMKSKLTDDRRSAAALLGNQEPAEAVATLITALADGDEWVRKNAVASLRALAHGRDFGEDAAQWSAWWDKEPK